MPKSVYFKTSAFASASAFALAGFCPPAIAEPFGGAPPPPPVMVPTDVTNVPLILGLPMGPPYMPKLDKTSAIKRLSSANFPQASEANEEEGGIIVEAKKDSDYTRINYGTVELAEGEIFVSVRKPAKVAFITTPQGTVAVEHDGDVLVTFADGVLRVLNLSAFDERVKVQIHHAAVSAKIVLGGASSGGGSNDPGLPGSAGKKTDIQKDVPDLTNGPSLASTEGIVMALKLGHELLVSDRTLNRADLTPADGIARRRSAVFENDHMAVTEFSLASAMTQEDFISNLSVNNPDPKERKVLEDLAKMASVLIYVNGSGGFVTSVKRR